MKNSNEEGGPPLLGFIGLLMKSFMLNLLRLVLYISIGKLFRIGKAKIFQNFVSCVCGAASVKNIF